MLAMVPAAVAGVVASRYLPETLLSFEFIEPIDPNLNPLETYPNRDWERVYRDIYSYDSSFIFLCAPNDTHGCLLRAYEKNGVVKYLDPSFGYGKATDLYNNKASPRWDPRMCPNGHTYLRRTYSDRRVKGAFVRAGFKDWVDAGMPRQADGLPVRSYFENRGKDAWERIPWDSAYDLIARVLVNVAQTYSGASGAALLTQQGYDPDMIAATNGTGVQTLKFRASMAWLSTLRFTGLYRLANQMALLDAWIRGVTPDQAEGARYWDSYAWHTDLPPGHPMVTGNKTSDFDLYMAEHSDLITTWGMNWIATKMPDGHWLTEARIRGAKVITITTEYQSTSNKADEVIVIRPATDTAFALAVAHVLMRDNLYDASYVKRYTDLPLLVRMDTLKLLRARDLIAGYTPAPLSNYVQVLQAGESPPPLTQQDRQYIPQSLRNAWDDFVVWDLTGRREEIVTRDHVGDAFTARNLDPALTGSFTVRLATGGNVQVRPIFDLLKEYVDANFTPAQASEITWAPVSAIEGFAREIAAHSGKTLFTVGMGPNHYWTNDLKDRAIFLIACLTGSEGRFGGEVGSYAGNYRLEIFNGVGQWASEDPFNLETDPALPARVRTYRHGESAHYYNYSDRPLRVGNTQFTGQTHMPTPTKTAWWVNGNSILGNAKWAYDVIANTLPKMEMIVVNEWFWTKTCEYADIVLGVPAWLERKIPDLYGACTNPFLQAIVPTPLPALYDVRDDLETYIGVAEKLAQITGDTRFADAWSIRTTDGLLDTLAYGQRVMNASNSLRGYAFTDLLDSCAQGIPKYMLLRTSPRLTGWEQINESKPWYTKTGRLEFYREEDEWVNAGENLPVFRETVDSTFYEPAVILDGGAHPALRPKGPADYGLDPNDLSTETRQVRNVVKSWADLKATQHPLMSQGYGFILYTPKYRHACHSMAASQDLSMVYFGPFGDFYRHDRRMPYVGEGYVDMNPIDAKALGIEDGDYIWVDGDPQDRPFRGWETRPDDYRVMRWKVRARYYPGIPRGTARAWFHMYGSTHGSVEGHETRLDGLAKSPRTGYQAAYRYGSHQSITRAWLKPTLMTDSLVRKDDLGHRIGTGFAVDVHGATGAPKESFVIISKAEDGGIGGVGLWDPAWKGFRPTYEDARMRRYLNGEYGGP
jgi:nitrate reductase alpha subunit